MSTSVPASALLLARGRPRRRDVAFLPLHTAAMALVVILSLGSIGLLAYEPPDSHTTLAIVTGVVGLGLIAYSRYFLDLPWVSAPVVYLLLFWTFHFGMTFTAVLVPSVLTKIPEDELEWFYLPSTRLSMILSLVGAASFVLSIGFFARRGATIRRPIETSYEPSLYIVGWLLLLMGTAVLVVIFAMNGGPAVFSMDVLEFRASVLSPTVLPTAIDLAQLGCVLALCGGGRRWPWPLLMWALGIATPMMLVGLRSAAMVPLVTYAAVLAHRGVRLRRSVVAAAVLGSLIAIPAISVFRMVGFSNRDLVNWTEVTPLDTFMELGGSLQSTRAYVDWIDDGDRFLLGSSYWAPIDRQILTRVIPGRELIPYEDDERVPIRLMVERESAVGGSATGEAYYNFGSFGPVAYFAVVGILFGLFQRFHASAYGSAMLGALIMPLYFNIRSDWLSVPAQIGEGLALVAFCYVLARIVFVRALAGSPQSGSIKPSGRGSLAVHDV